MWRWSFLLLSLLVSNSKADIGFVYDNVSDCTTTTSSKSEYDNIVSINTFYLDCNNGQDGAEAQVCQGGDEATIYGTCTCKKFLNNELKFLI